MTDDNKQYKPLSIAELQKLTALFSHMSPAAKEAFIAMVMIKFEDNFYEIITYLGEKYKRSVPRA